MFKDRDDVLTDEHIPAHIRITPGTLRPIEPVVSGYKHAMVPLIATCIGLGQNAMLQNCPWVDDTRVLVDFIRLSGGSASYDKGTLWMDTCEFSRSDVPAELARRVHGSLYLLPVLLGRFGSVTLPATGGCYLSDQEENGRPIDHILKVLTAFGATFTLCDGVIHGRCNGYQATCLDIQDFSERTDVLTSSRVSGATKTAILAALFVKEGKTIIKNPYPKPDVWELLHFLRLLGYRIEQNVDEIQIAPPLAADVSIRTAPYKYFLMSCISTIMTYITLALHTHIPLTIHGVTAKRVQKGMAAELALLEQMGVHLVWGTDTIFIPAWTSPIYAVDIDVTSVGIYSDHQPFFALLLLQGDRSVRIREFVWPQRFDYARELVKLGAKIQFQDRSILVTPSHLDKDGQILVARDLRSAAALLIASMTIKGSTEIRNIDHITRGYEKFLDVLRAAGMNIEPIIVQSDESRKAE